MPQKDAEDRQDPIENVKVFFSRGENQRQNGRQNRLHHAVPAGVLKPEMNSLEHRYFRYP